MATETTTITAGTVDEYINKLSELGKPVLQARIAKLKAKLKHFAGIAKSGKYAAAGKPGPKNKQHLAGAVRYCQGALSWHESALQKVGTATASMSAVVADGMQEWLTVDLGGSSPKHGFKVPVVNEKAFVKDLEELVRKYSRTR